MQVLFIAAFAFLISQTARVAVIVEGATCNSVDVTDPLSSTDSSMGWVSEAMGAGERRQGHITAEVEAWDHAYLVIYGGTNVRNDDVNGVSARGSSLWILDNENPRNWTELEMIGYNGNPEPLFRPDSFVWINSLFLVCGHTPDPFSVTDEVWRADIQGFQETEASEGLWRPVNVSIADDLVGSVDNIPRYGHSATIFETGEAEPTEAWVAVIGGMTGTQGTLDVNLILHLSESAETFQCDDQAFNTTNTLTCAERTHVRPTESKGEWWSLEPRLSTSNAESRPVARAYHAAASLSSDGRGSASCVYIFGGRDYEKSLLFSDLWRLCPVSGYLGGAADTTFRWTELSPKGDLPRGRYGATLSAGIRDAPNRLILYGGTGKFPVSYMTDEFTGEYDAYMNAWVHSSRGNGDAEHPAGRRDHTMETIGHDLVLIGGINNEKEALMDMWRVSYSSPVCGSGAFMFFCDEMGAPVCATCPNGTATERASYTCQTCPSGYYAEAGANQCTPCPAGKYGTGIGGVVEASACSDCPAGTSTTRGVGTPSIDGCIECEAGTYSLEGALECTPCPSGFYSDTRASKCTACAAGTYRQESSASGDCTNCAAGTYAPFQQASVCLDCPRGYYSEAGAVSCSPCPAGTAGGSVAGGALAEACVNCKAGEYSSEEGLSACEPCPAGTASSTIGAISALVCETCPVGTFASDGARVCQDCVAGQYSDQVGAETCQLCPVGSFLEVTGSDSVDACLHCPQGSTTLVSGAKSSLDCALCAPGTHSVSLLDGGGCEECPRGQYTSTYVEAQALNCIRCSGGFYADTIGSEECTECASEEVSYSGHASCAACISNTSCPLGPNGESCSGLGDCILGVCKCREGFNNVDCSNGTCDGCSGVFGFDFSSSFMEIAEADAAGTVDLTLVRLAGTDGEITVEVSVTGGNATGVLDYGGTWPRQVVFSAGQSKAMVPLHIVHDDRPNEGCEFVSVGVSSVSSVGSIVVNGGIHDVSAEAIVVIEESDFTSAILGTEDVSSGRGGGLSPTTAEVVIADAAATWGSNVTLSVIGSIPIDHSLAVPPLDILLLLEAHSTMSEDLELLAKLMPGLAAEMQSSYSSPTMFGAAAFATNASSYSYELLWPLSMDVYQVVDALDVLAANSLSISHDPPGAQVAALYDAAGSANGAGWRDEAFCVIAVVTGSHFAQEAGFDSLDASTWTLPHGVTLSGLKSRLSSTGTHPIFLLTNQSLVEAYEAFVREIGFGTAVAFDPEKAMSESYNDFYLPRALADGLKALYAQAALVVESDDGGFLSSISPVPDAFRNETPGSEITFNVSMSSDAASSREGGEITLSFQGHRTVITIVRDFTSCHAPRRSRVTGTTSASSDASRNGWLQRFYSDEDTRWILSPAFSIDNQTPGPFGVADDVLKVSCPVDCRDEKAYQDVSMDVDSQLPMVLKAHFYLSPGSVATAVSASLRVTYADGSASDEVVSILNFEAFPSSGTVGIWSQDVYPIYPTHVVAGARVTLSFSGVGDAAFAGVGLFAHPDIACRCTAGYYLDVSSAPAKTCMPQPDCMFFEGWCVYCPAGYKCPQGGVLAACQDGEFSMGGSVECSPCPVGWLCSEGLAVPCGYGTYAGPRTTNVQENEGASSSTADVFGGTCTDCPAGSACPGAGLRVECSPGTFSPGGAASNTCMPCPPGTFANEAGSSRCEDCAAGYTSTYGASECFEVPPGFTSEES